MFEIPEYTNLARQINQTLRGKRVVEGRLGNSPHKFVWYNRTPEEFSRLMEGKILGTATVKGRWMPVALDPGYVLLFGECGGKILVHENGADLPKKYHLILRFDDGSALTAMTQMWGAMELFEAGKELERQYIKGMRTTPDDPAFTYEYFSGLLDELLVGAKRSVKGLLTQDQLLPGLGNAIAQDILFQARLHPRHSLVDLDQGQRKDLYAAIVDTLQEVISKGGRYDEVDLFGKPGGYQRVMDTNSCGKPCPECGRTVEKMAFLGGSCYFCPNCQG